MKKMKTHWNRTILMVMTLIGILVLAAGCGLAEVPGEPTEPMPEEKEYSVTLYFAHTGYVETGDETLPKLVEVRDVPMTAQEGRQYFQLVDSALRQIPEGTFAAATLIDDSIQVHDVVVDDGTAIVDLSSRGLNNGSLAEAYVISQIVESLRASFPEVQQVQFLVDGAVVESLMGHFGAEEPFTEGIFNLQGE